MSDVVLAITQPANGIGLAGPVTLKGTAAGNTAALFFKWFSSLNSAATASQPEINADHSIASLTWNTPVLGEFGSHTVVLAATDKEGTDLPSIKAIRRSAMAGGAPPAAPAPCVVHQVGSAMFHASVVNGQTLSKAGATVAVLAPGSWAMPDPAHAGSWIANTSYQALNGVGLRLNLAPFGPPDAAHTADIPLVPSNPGLPFFRDADKTWLRWTGALPANVVTGNYVLSLIASAGSAATTLTRFVVLTA